MTTAAHTATANTAGALTSALNHYLEAIYSLTRGKSFVRVRDIASARGVRSASVSPAMRRLSELGLIEYVRREYITLTPTGETEARRVEARNQVLRRFFRDVLCMTAAEAKEDASAIEHNLSAKAMDRLVRFLEYAAVCPSGDEMLDRFHQCSLVHDDVPACSGDCNSLRSSTAHPRIEERVIISSLRPGQKGKVAQVQGNGAIRQRLLDMGILPDVIIQLERVAPTGDPIWIKLQGYQISLRKTEADAVLVTAA